MASNLPQSEPREYAENDVLYYYMYVSLLGLRNIKLAYLVIPGMGVGVAVGQTPWRRNGEQQIVALTV